MNRKDYELMKDLVRTTENLPYVKNGSCTQLHKKLKSQLALIETLGGVDVLEREYQHNLE
jgi:hypothetical protein